MYLHALWRVLAATGDRVFRGYHCDLGILSTYFTSTASISVIRGVESRYWVAAMRGYYDEDLALRWLPIWGL